MRPRLKSLNCLAGDDTLLVSLDPRQRIELADPTGQVLAMLQLLHEGTRTPEQLATVLAHRWPDVSVADVHDVLEALNDFGWLEDADARLQLSEYQRERYFSNLAFFDGFTSLDRPREAYQARLLNSRVLLLGAGGLGSSVLQNLAGLGVGHVTLVDFDRVELKNLARQFTYGEAQVGAPKVEQLARWVRSFNTEMRVEAINRRIETSDDVLQVLSDAELVISAIDQPDDIDLIVNAACMAAAVPFIRGGLAYLQGLYWSVQPGRSACRLCLDTHREVLADNVDSVLTRWPSILRADRPNRAIGPVAQLLGALVSMEALRYLTGLTPPVSAGCYQLVDFSTDCSITSDAWPRDPACPLCNTVRTVPDASVHETTFASAVAE
jgi:molybdopterin/thiamine biosynthesis adenylyltransferase